MAFDWTDISTLTPAQRIAAAYFESLASEGAQLTPPPSYTYSQTKAARAYLIEMYQKLDAARRGVRLVLDYYEKKAVKDFVDSATFEQLIVYFAGHGVNIGYQEYWLI